MPSLRSPKGGDVDHLRHRLSDQGFVFNGRVTSYLLLVLGSRTTDGSSSIFWLNRGLVSTASL